MSHMLVGIIWNDALKFSPLLSSVLVILIFILSQLIAANSRKAELRRSWYFKAYLDKSIDKINEFFTDSRAIMTEALKDSANLMKEEDRSNYITAKLEAISDKQRDFKHQVLAPLQGYYPKLFKYIDTLLDGYYDVHSSAFDKLNDQTKALRDYLFETDMIRNNLMAFLATPVINNKQSRKIRRSLALQNELNERFNYGKLFIVFMSLILIVLLTTQYIKHHPSYPKSHLNSEAAADHTKDLVLERILCPSTAAFDSNMEAHCIAINESTFLVKSFVDSQNQYGAMVRTYFTCKVCLFDDNRHCIVQILKMK